MQQLSQDWYEALRWTSWVLLPASATFIGAMNMIWNLGLPIEQIMLTLTAVETFIGAVLGFSKIAYDEESRENQGK